MDRQKPYAPDSPFYWRNKAHRVREGSKEHKTLWDLQRNLNDTGLLTVVEALHVFWFYIGHYLGPINEGKF